MSGIAVVRASAVAGDELRGRMSPASGVSVTMASTAGATAMASRPVVTTYMKAMVLQELRIDLTGIRIRIGHQDDFVTGDS